MPITDATTNGSIAETSATHNGSATHPAEKPVKEPAAKSTRPNRPNYALIHARPLPVEVFPLPAFIPHNPLSFFRIAVALLAHVLWRPKSVSIMHSAYFSPETQSVHVTDPTSVRALWEQGFWGTGSLSRSEPQWLEMEKRKRGSKKGIQTSIEVTEKRRRERERMKLERARLQTEAIEEQQRLEMAGGSNGGPVDLDSPVLTDQLDEAISADTQPISDEVAPSISNGGPELKSSKRRVTFSEVVTDEPPVEIENQEHLQLTLEEAFFLTYVFGALDVTFRDTTIPAWYLFRLCCANSTFPASETSTRLLESLSQIVQHPHPKPTTPAISPISPDNAFILRYAVYHHFRSLGWVVRSGIKFSVDFLIYERGPAFTHAQFAIMILPSYSHAYWTENEERKAYAAKMERRDWWWLHRVNRVQSQVFKTLMLVYVEVPPPWDERAEGEGFRVDVGAVLKRYKVREVIVSRWTPNRNRD